MGRGGKSVARPGVYPGLVIAVACLGCRTQTAPVPPPRPSAVQDPQEAPCDDALGKAPLGAAAVTAFVDRLTFKQEDDRDELVATASFPAPIPSAPTAPPADDVDSASEVKRQALPDGRCAVWLQTGISPGAPAATSTGVLAILVKEGASVRVEAATRFSADEGTLGFGRSRSYGVVTLYVAKDDAVGTGAEERGASECIWSVSKDRIDDALCYYAEHSVTPLHGAGWSITSTTRSTFSQNGVVLHTHVRQGWSPPSETQKGCRPTWLDRPDDSWLEPHELVYDYEEPYALTGMTLTAAGVYPNVPRRDTDSNVPKWVDDKASELRLPAVVGGDADLDCSPESPE